MNRTKIQLLWPMLAASLLSSCDSNDKQNSSSNSTGNKLAAAAPNPDLDADRCIHGLAIKVGDDDIRLELTGTQLFWNATGGFLKLEERGKAEVELVASTSIGGPSLPVGDCLRSGGYIRLAGAKRTDANRYLQAFQQASPDKVLIGNFPDPDKIDSIFNIVKDPQATSNSAGAIIRRGDIVHIRGVSRDPWLKAPANPTDGATVGLINWDQFDNASQWTITRRGPPTQPNPN